MNLKVCTQRSLPPRQYLNFLQNVSHFNACYISTVHVSVRIKKWKHCHHMVAVDFESTLVVL